MELEDTICWERRKGRELFGCNFFWGESRFFAFLQDHILEFLIHLHQPRIFKPIGEGNHHETEDQDQHA